MKTNSYICPFDLAGGMVTKGTIYKRYLDSAFYTPEGLASLYRLPQEIVEKWEKVPKFKFGDYVTLSDCVGKVLKVSQDYVKVLWFKDRYLETECKEESLRLATYEEMRKARLFEVVKGEVIEIYSDNIFYSGIEYSFKDLKQMLEIIELNKNIQISIGNIKLNETLLQKIITNMNKW